MTTGSCDKDMQESLSANIRDILSIRKQTIVHKEADNCFLKMLILVTRRQKNFTSTFTFFHLICLSRHCVILFTHMEADYCL